MTDVRVDGRYRVEHPKLGFAEFVAHVKASGAIYLGSAQMNWWEADGWTITEIAPPLVDGQLAWITYSTGRRGVVVFQGGKWQHGPDAEPICDPDSIELITSLPVDLS